MAEDTKPTSIKVTDTPRKPGRPAGSTTAATRKNEDVRQAMATLDSAYNVVGVAVAMTGLTKTAEAWVDATDRLKAQNEDALNASPKLAAFLANAGQTGGVSTFAIAHVIALGNVYAVARAEIAARSADKPKRERNRPGDVEADPLIPESSVVRDPTMIPGM